MQSGTKILENNVDVLNLIHTSQLYELINDCINKYNHRNKVQGFINDRVGNTNIPMMVQNSNKTTYTEQDEINDLDEDLGHLHYGLKDNINDDDNENSHNITNLVDNELKPNKTIGAHFVEEKEAWIYEWPDTYDK